MNSKADHLAIKEAGQTSLEVTQNAFKERIFAVFMLHYNP
jgi:hypothetical protein